MAASVARVSPLSEGTGGAFGPEELEVLGSELVEFEVADVGETGQLGSLALCHSRLVEWSDLTISE